MSSSKIIQLMHPQTGAECDFSIANLSYNKNLSFRNGEEIICNNGIYEFVGLSEKILGYDREESIGFEKRYITSSISKDINAFHFFQKKVIDQCTLDPVLSVACGTMYWDCKLKFKSVFIPVDISKYMLRIALLKKRNRFAFQASGTKLPFCDNQFGLSYCIDGLPEMFYSGSDGKSSRREILREMQRVTMEGGKIALLLPNRNLTVFSNTIKFKRFRNVSYDEYGFSPTVIKKEILDLGYEIIHFSFKRNLGPFKSYEFIRAWNSLLDFTKINFLGYIFIIIKV